MLRVPECLGSICTFTPRVRLKDQCAGRVIHNFLPSIQDDFNVCTFGYFVVKFVPVCVCVKVSVGVPFHLNLFVKLSIILSTGGHLLMIDAAPLNVMDGSAATRWARHPSLPPHAPPPPPGPCEEDACPVSFAGGGTKPHST